MLSNRLLSLTLSLLVAASPLISAAQWGQQGSPPTGPQRGGTPPTFPTETHPASTMPPDTAAPPPTESSNFKVERQITTAIAQERRLKRENISVEVGDDAVTLTGKVSNDDHRYIALQIAGDYAGTRSLVDSLQLHNER